MTAKKVLIERKTFLTFRIDENLRNKYKSALAAKAETMQAHLERCVNEYVQAANA